MATPRTAKTTESPQDEASLSAKDPYPISVEEGRSADLPRMSKRLRRVLEEIAETIEVEVPLEEEGTDTALTFDGLEIKYERRRITWSSPEGSGEKRLPKSKIKGVVRSLLSNAAGQVVVGGFKHVSWHLSAEEVADRAIANGVIIPAEEEEGEGGRYHITQEGIRDNWDAAFQLLDDALTVEIHLSETGRELTATLQAWNEAKQKGVPLSLALSNENLPESYLRPSERRDPGRLRSRGLYKETIGGEAFYGKSDLIVRGSPPELAEKHRSNTDRIKKTLANMEVRSAESGEARPVGYMEDESEYRSKEYVILKNGMHVDVQNALFVRKQFPGGTWTTAHYEATHSTGFGEEGDEKTVEGEFVVVLDEEGDILASLPPYQNGTSSDNSGA